MNTIWIYTEAGYEQCLRPASCVLRSACCVMLGARRMLGAMENMEFNNIY